MPKIKYLHADIDHINLLYNLNTAKLHLDNSNLESYAWLAEITYADGYF